MCRRSIRRKLFSFLNILPDLLLPVVQVVWSFGARQSNSSCIAACWIFSACYSYTLSCCWNLRFLFHCWYSYLPFGLRNLSISELKQRTDSFLWFEVKLVCFDAITTNFVSFQLFCYRSLCFFSVASKCCKLSFLIWVRFKSHSLSKLIVWSLLLFHTLSADWPKSICFHYMIPVTRYFQFLFHCWILFWYSFRNLVLLRFLLWINPFGLRCIEFLLFLWCNRWAGFCFSTVVLPSVV